MKTNVAGFARIQNVLNSGESSYENMMLNSYESSYENRVTLGKSAPLL